MLDVPKYLLLEREIDGELGDDGFEAVAAYLRAARVSPVSQVGRTLEGGGWRLSSKEGKTRLRVFADARGAAIGAAVLSVLGGGFAGLVVLGVVHDLFLRSLTEVHALWLVPLTIGLAFPFMRGLFRRGALSGQRTLRASFEAVVEIAKRHAVLPEVARPRMRVEADADDAPREAEEVEEVEELEEGGHGGRSRRPS